MKSAWRELLSSAAIGFAAVVSSVTCCGCQTWSPSSWGVPTSARVQPPPTGTVRPQGAYYSNPPTGTSASPVNTTTQTATNFSAPVVQASAVNSLGSGGGMPVTSLGDSAGTFSSVSKAFGSQTAGDAHVFSTPVSTADYNDTGSGIAQVVSAGSMQGSGNFSSDSGLGSRANPADNANLQWKTAK
jgi:hypothetical protein